MVYKCDSVPWGLYVGWALNNIAQEVNLHSKQAKKKRFDFLMVPFFPPMTQRQGDINDFLQKSFIRAGCFLLRLQNFNRPTITTRDTPDTCHQTFRNRYYRPGQIIAKIQQIAFEARNTVCGLFRSGINRLENHRRPRNSGLKVSQISQKGQSCPNNFNKIVKNISAELILEFTLSKDETLSWHQYNDLRILLEYNISVFLQMGKDLPNKSEQKRWLAENVRCIGISTDLFTINDKGFPHLADQYESFLKSFFQFETRFALSSPNHRMDLSEQRELLCHIFKKQEPLSKDEYQSYDYFDVLQEPLQPYRDNLQSSTYDIFEQDAPKYNYYETACYNYFMDNQQQFSEVLLAGAGRGGILKRIIKAAQQAKVKFHIVALEKNQFAFLTLTYLKEMNKWSFVDIVLADLKTWDKPPSFDLIVSELLGSFGDNELSPECLFWAKKFIKPGGISIPYDSVNYITPISCPMIHSKTKKQSGLKGLQKTYVINLKQIISTSTIEPCFEFIHFEEIFTKEKIQVIQFKFKQDYLIHGLAGYFESTLYKDTKLSIHPLNHTPKMLSWFPLFLPFEVAKYVLLPYKRNQ